MIDVAATGMTNPATPLPTEATPTAVPMPLLNQRFTSMAVATMPPNPYAMPASTAPARKAGSVEAAEYTKNAAAVSTIANERPARASRKS